MVQNPEMLGSGLKLVGRQTRTQSGWLDLLAVDQDGRLVVYELKRGTLARDAVTRVLDYASDLDAMSAGDLAEHIVQRSGSGGIQGIDDFEQWYADNTASAARPARDIHGVGGHGKRPCGQSESIVLTPVQMRSRNRLPTWADSHLRSPLGPSC